MDKINFINNNEPYLSAENLNQMQDNIEDGINKITEIGENDNGVYIKHANGILECFHTMATNNQNTSSHYQYGDWTFPMPYISIPVVIATPFNWTTNGYMVKVKPNLTKCGVLQTIINSNGSFVDKVGDEVCLHAIGKWK